MTYRPRWPARTQPRRPGRSRRRHWRRSGAGGRWATRWAGAAPLRSCRGRGARTSGRRRPAQHPPLPALSPSAVVLVMVGGGGGGAGRRQGGTLLSPLMRRLVLLMEVQWTGNHVMAPMLLHRRPPRLAPEALAGGGPPDSACTRTPPRLTPQRSMLRDAWAWEHAAAGPAGAAVAAGRGGRRGGAAHLPLSAESKRSRVMSLSTSCRKRARSAAGLAR